MFEHNRTFLLSGLFASFVGLAASFSFATTSELVRLSETPESFSLFELERVVVVVLLQSAHGLDLYHNINYAK